MQVLRGMRNVLGGDLGKKSPHTGEHSNEVASNVILGSPLVIRFFQARALLCGVQVIVCLENARNAQFCVQPAALSCAFFF